MPGISNFSPALTGLIPVLVAIASGAVIPFQAGANAVLGRSLGHPLWAAVASLLVSLMVVLPLLLLLKAPMPALALAARGPAWTWAGGVAGVFYISAALLLAPRLGAGGFIAAVVAGQMAGALLLDQFGLAGFAVRAVTPGRLAGALLVVLGVVVVQFAGTGAASPAPAAS
ncbi:DMT family transporter [Cupriavidus sp. 2MCAB6]|uniref:DMT family transporter n=1 Tax=Cupriavidus sp. 2MCAB6 TaxID=3232981 RepID=UPI003F9067B4